MQLEYKQDAKQNPKQYPKQRYVPDMDIKFTTPHYKELMKRRDNLDAIFADARAALDQEIAFQMNRYN